MKRLEPRLDPDGLDLEQLRMTLDSPGYGQIKVRQARSYAAELAKLATSDSWDNTRYLQGFLAGLQAAAELPRIMLDEYKRKVERKRCAQ